MILKTLITTFTSQSKIFCNAAYCRIFCTSAKFGQKTIFALSSGHGKCGIAVIRVSGSESCKVLKQLCGLQTLPAPRHASLKRLLNPITKEVIDKGMVIWFPGPASFTGEDCIEFHVHGGIAVVAAMLEALGSLAGLTPAEPGDFTKRAFLNGKMGLTEVEGLGDLIHAETEAQRRQALRQMDGELGHLFSNWRARILKCLANVEAFIDFSEDENIEQDTLDLATLEVQKVIDEIANHLADNRKGERLRDGVHVVIIGEPNVGKSSLLNVLCQYPAAIVSPIPGTTRDVIEKALNIGGYPVLLSDTAGLRETSDAIENEGIERALSRAMTADLKILIMDAIDIFHLKLPSTSWSQFLLSHLTSLGIIRSCGSNPKYLSKFSNDSPQTAIQVNATVDQTVGSVIFQNCPHGGKTIRDLELDYINGGRVSNTQEIMMPPNFIVQNSHGTNIEDLVPGDNSHSLVLDRLIVALNKTDLVPKEMREMLPSTKEFGVPVCHLSCTTSEGLNSFISLLAGRVKQLFMAHKMMPNIRKDCGDPLVGSPSLTQARHRVHLHRCQVHLRSYLLQIEKEDIVLAAEALRRGMRELGRVTGVVSVEDVLDVIFKDFCIGK